MKQKLRKIPDDRIDNWQCHLGGTSVYAEEPEQVFTLDPMIVTAQGFETKGSRYTGCGRSI